MGLSLRALSVGLALLAAPACSASWQGARLYASGTEALERGDTTHAVRSLEEAARLVPHASEIQNHLGAAYAASGRDAEALAAFQRAVDLDCDNAAAKRNLDSALASQAAQAERDATAGKR